MEQEDKFFIINKVLPSVSLVWTCFRGTMLNMVGCHGYEDQIQLSGQPETNQHPQAPVNKCTNILEYVKTKW